MDSPCIRKYRKVSTLCPPDVLCFTLAFDLFVVIRSLSLVGGSATGC